MISFLLRLPLLSRVSARLQRSPLLHRVARATFWNLIAAGLPRVVPLFAFILVARLLGKEVFGALGAIQNTVIMLGTFAGFGLGITATACAARYRRSDPEKAGRILAGTIALAFFVSITLSALLASFASYFAQSWLHSETLVRPLRLASVLLALNAVNGVQVAALAGLEAFKESAIASLWSSSLSLVCVAGALWGLDGAIISLIGSGAVGCIVYDIVLRRVAARAGVRIRYACCWKERAVVLSYSVPAGLGNILYAPVFWICTTLLLRMPDGYAEMGEFTAANQWRSLMMLFPSILGQAVIPIVSDCLAQGRRLEAIVMLRKMITSLAYVNVPVFLVLCVCSPAIMLAYGPTFKSAWPTFCLLQAVVLVQVLQSPVIKFMESIGDLWLTFIFNMGHALIMVLSAMFFIRMGSAGLALALLTAITFHTVCLSIYGAKRMRTPQNA